jgi:opacity protein-like surface antigen
MKKLLIATALFVAAAAAAKAQATAVKTDAAAAQAGPAGGAGQAGPARIESPPRPSAPDPPPERLPDPEATPTPGEVTDSPGVEDAGAPASGEPVQAPDGLTTEGKGFRWRAALEQTSLFLAVQHGYALTQPKTRRDLRGPFFRDYVRSVRSMSGWADGGRFFTNYVAHPMQGSLLGFIQVQNDPAGSRRRFGKSGGYWRSRMKALAWSAAWSTQFEIGPVSQASIGNVGLHGKQTYVDVVMTPTAGLGMLVAEDALDRYLIERIERRTGNRYVRIFSRMALNPTRTAANLLRFKKPWHRDAGLR